MTANSATFVALSLILISCNANDSNKSNARKQNEEKFSKIETRDAHFVVDVVDTFYDLLNVAELAESKMQDTLSKLKIRKIIQTQTSALHKLKAFADANEIAIPFSDPEKTSERLNNLSGKNNNQEFHDAWIQEIKDLQRKLKNEVEKYRDKTLDSSLVNVLDSTVLILNKNQQLISELELSKNEKSK